MTFEEILQQQGWELANRQGWIAVHDRRPAFRPAFTTNRVGKMLGTTFYVTLTQLADVVQGLVRQLGCDPLSVKSTNGTRDATYWGFDTNGVSEDKLTLFVTRLAASIDHLL